MAGLFGGEIRCAIASARLHKFADHRPAFPFGSLLLPN